MAVLLLPCLCVVTVLVAPAAAAAADSLGSAQPFLAGPPEPSPRRRRRRTAHVGRHGGGLRTEVRRHEERRLQPPALRRTIRGEHILGQRGRQLDGRQRGSLVGLGEAVLQLQRRLVRR
ncbi:Os02g0472632 [Oryza sativa Japonica Group]|uniref:Os02g0472632 protein n=1 Tax=Oryza sativa subsp. japonica TaxID=39947 RepID=A0A0P0VJ20_ORYSJ|nr:Os02g0472632 [Oryza sativa Japonica Group]